MISLVALTCLHHKFSCNKKYKTQQKKGDEDPDPEENPHIFWTIWKIWMNFSRKRWLIKILKVAKSKVY